MDRWEQVKIQKVVRIVRMKNNNNGSMGVGMYVLRMNNNNDDVATVNTSNEVTASEGIPSSTTGVSSWFKKSECAS
jgi:hypothetical protein